MLVWWRILLFELLFRYTAHWEYTAQIEKRQHANLEPRDSRQAYLYAGTAASYVAS